IRQVRERAVAARDDHFLSELDGMVSQMRAHLAGPELTQFDARLAGDQPQRVVRPPARPGEGPTVSLNRVTFAMLRGWLCCLLIVIGAFGPWIKTAFGASASGVDNSNDGWIMLVGALFAAILIFSFIHDPDRRSRVFRAVVLTLIGAALAGVGVYD